MSALVVIALVMWTRVLSVMFAQALAHLVAADVQRTLRSLPNDRTVSPSPGLYGHFLIGDRGRIILAEHAWRCFRLMAICRRIHPWDVALRSTRVEISTASVCELRLVLAALRQHFLSSQGRRLLLAIAKRACDLRSPGWPDISDGEEQSHDDREWMDFGD